jgi:hypothetical protein
MTRNEVKRLQNFIWNASYYGHALSGYARAHDGTLYHVDTNKSHTLFVRYFLKVGMKEKPRTIVLESDEAFWSFFRHIQCVKQLWYSCPEPTRYKNGTKYF